MLAAALVAVPGPALAAHKKHHSVRLNPVIFVHGFEGSGSQFESQKMRLTSNGYPDRYITTFE